MIIAAALTLIMIVLGIPVAYAFGIGGLFAFASFGDVSQLPSVTYHAIDSYPLLAIPFFLLAGEIMKSGGVTRRLVNFVAIFTGWIRGGMGLNLLGASAIFGAISGSSIATVSAIGSIMTPEMVKRGYPRNYIGGITSVAGLLGILIPPSIPMIVYGMTANVSISQLFLSGISAGILLFLAMAIVNLWWARKRVDLRDRVEEDQEESPTTTGGTIKPSGSLRTLQKAPGTTRVRVSPLHRIGVAIPALLMPIIILGGIYSGLLTPTESGAAACVYGLLVGLLIYREIKPNNVPQILSRSILAAAPIMLIIALGGVFSRALTLSGVTTELTMWIESLNTPTWVILVAMNILLLLVGCFVEENTAIIILTPLLLPIAVGIGVDPVHFGMIMVLNLGMGLATPPMAPNIFVAARACQVPFHKIIGTAGFFLLTAALPVLIIINAFPALSLWYR
ncbi:TRAP transporter large permease [Arthrobacter gengyunqii]|uniref:TRAP transporter large permease n=1 Tax=Arthrobacter gengyunqii TaxID=2886940 RepID=A0A9X1M0S0_9MICC|nr:TRAP transporter large permease [Arthrobacter gengyunqii]MCC3269169.1 TRAP transporter large permease [Arthrobacter gengyunqii]UOY94871.1 TRAP transporter large permease [Arthrobacter gengyunqii]